MTRRRKLFTFAGLGAVVIALAGAGGCVRFSGDTWYVHSAATPEGWPELTPVGEVEMRTYPAYRAAVVAEDATRAGADPMFMTLFRHISSNDIAMTAPVDMSYTAVDSTEPTEMAFLYRTAEVGAVGPSGRVEVRDVEPRTFASVGVRGGYTSANYAKGLSTLEAWLETQADVTPAGPPRYLGYNSPFVPVFMRYGEVQIPVEAVR